MSEIWAPIPGYEGLYEASTEGRVRNRHGRIMKQDLSNKNRPAVKLSSLGLARTRFVHHLVLEAFVGPCPEGLQCCHWDDDKSNNKLANLRWDTSSANAYDQVRNGKHHMTPAYRRAHRAGSTPIRAL